MKKHNKEIEQVHTIMSTEFERTNRERERDITEVYRTIDSRLDKLESKLGSRKA